MRKVCFLVLALLPLLAAADYGPVIVTQVTRVYDGDTFYVDVAEWPPVIGEAIGVRVKDINTPELRSRCETEATKARERALARDAKAFVEESLADAERIELHHIERGSFFRLVADVWVDGENLGEVLMKEGFARPYREGQAGQAWCEPREERQ